ncbi:MAG: D-alanyl-D-alanine carboxypeptidase family protein [Fusobacteriaceae bacterium]
MKKIMGILLLITSIGAFGNKIEVASDLVGDGQGNVYWGENIHKVHPLASVTKVMTMMITFDEIAKGKISLEDDVVIKPRAARVGGSMIPVKVGQVFKLKDLLKAVGMHSANNAAYAVAEHVGGTYENFIKMMNDKAEELGVSEELTYNTPAGLPTHMTREKLDTGSAYAMYKVMLEAIKYPEYLDIAGTKTSVIPGENGEPIYLRNKNHLLGKEGIKGLKTGYHTISGFNIVVYNDKEGIRNYYVVFGGKTAKERDAKVLELDKEFHENYKNNKILDKDKYLTELKVYIGKTDSVKLYPEKDLDLVLSKDDDVKIDLEPFEKLEAPLDKDKNYGTYKVFKNGKQVEIGNLRIKESIERKSLIERIKKEIKDRL